jgi:hypothetical protein
MINTLDLEWLHSKFNHINKRLSHKYINVLVILDDVVCDVKNSELDLSLMKLFLNRRHCLDNGMVSILLTTQKYKKVPSSIR